MPGLFDRLSRVIARRRRRRGNPERRRTRLIYWIASLHSQ